MLRHVKKSAKLPVAIAIGSICIILIIINVIIGLSAYYIGEGSRGGINKVSDSMWHSNADPFNYDSFKVLNVTYDTDFLNSSVIPCYNENLTRLNVSAALWVDKEVKFYACKFFVDRGMREAILLSDFNGSAVPVDLGEITIREDHVFKFCCDNYCNEHFIERRCF